MELKVYEKLTTVKLKDGTQIQAPIPVDDLLKACNSGLTFIKLGGMMINVNTIMSADENKSTEIDNFVLSFDKEVQQRLRGIIEKRKKDNLKINIEVLRNAYKSAYGQDL